MKATVRELLLNTPPNRIFIRNCSNVVVDAVEEFTSGIKVIWFSADAGKQPTRHTSFIPFTNLERAYVERVSCDEYVVSVRDSKNNRLQIAVTLEPVVLSEDDRRVVDCLQHNLTTCFGVFHAEYGMASQVYEENDCVFLRWVISDEGDEAEVVLAPNDLVNAKFNHDRSTITITFDVPDRKRTEIELLLLKPYLPCVEAQRFEPGDKVLADFRECDGDDARPQPATYVTFHRGFHWVILEPLDPADSAYFNCITDEDYCDDTDALNMYPCKKVVPLPDDLVSDVDWESLPRNTEIRLDYTTPAWFADFIPNNDNSIAVYVNDKREYVPREKATRVVYVHERRCSLPKTYRRQ